MKRCTTCNRTYTDPALSFCIDDGTPLITVEPEDDETVVRSRTARTAESEDWNATAYQPPRSYVPPGGEVKRRRAWPWIVGIIGAFLLGILALSIAAMILVPRMIRAGHDQRANSNANRVVIAPSPEETNANSNANTNSTEHVETPAPTDREQVLAQLTDLENEWTVANLNADKKKLDRILADDYVGPSPDGGLQSKADYIRTIERDTEVEKWQFSDLHLTLAGDRATLSGTLTLHGPESQSRVFDFTDKFVWRDGRWQATGSQVKEREGVGTEL